MPDIKREDILRWLKSDDPGALFAAADSERAARFGNEVHIRGIIEFSNYCACNCLYCGLRKGNGLVKRYRMSAGEIIDTALGAIRHGYKTILLQSGEDKAYGTDNLCAIIKRIKSESDCRITLSLGELDFDEYKSLKDAGSDRYLLRFETSDRPLFKKLKPSCYDNRISCIKRLKSLGFQTGSGIMTGLPGQTYDTLCDDILLMRELGLDMIGIGPFIPHPNTPLGNNVPGGLELALRVIAAARLALPLAHIPATTAIGTIAKDGIEKALKCGANVFMPDITPPAFRSHYDIYPGKFCIGENPLDSMARAKAMLERIGRYASHNAGDAMAHAGDSVRGFKVNL
ncbi:MAG: [FeFe] hydrogenase H-cluster radical SAM maturase HydE [Candidatus Omnitrophica bacterium]|jgi:biotin synthase|nr:[FeFe] hydrogenase H-cluster radical SAM maturase HydE [Candidatus Omnitrophota bacterium]